MQNFILKLRNFMAGRNGVDKLSVGLIVLYSVFAFVKIFLRYVPAAYAVVTVIQYAVAGYAVFRIMSRNVQKRYNENFRFEQLLVSWKPYFEHMKLRFQYIRTHRFRTCKGCGEFLRFKKGKRKRRTVCPKCGKENNFYFLFK